VTLLALALALLVSGAIAALVATRRPTLSSALAVLGAVSGGAVGTFAALRVLFDPTRADALVVAWDVPYGQLHVAIDALSAFFLVPVFAFSAIAAVYGRSYLAGHTKRRRAMLWFAFDLLVASMAMVVMARQAVLFLVAWEVMTVCGYLLITYEHEDAEVRRAGWVYLIAAHVGTAFLLALFVLLGWRGASFDFDAIASASAAPLWVSVLVFALAILGFGVKAGVVPLHVWLPEAHAAAPSHVSAVMSAVLIKMGVYGIVRVLLLSGRPAIWWGPTLIILGLAGGVVGISLALYQRDLKRVLAYSSVENVGIILLGMGVGFWGASSGRPLVATLGVTGALLHVWNHTLMKGLLFLGAGSVVHGAGTKDLEKLGGLAQRMPRTSAAMITGAVAISALPPLNGFVSEFLVYVGLIQGAVAATSVSGVLALLAVGALSFIGALTVLSFVRLVGVALLGQPRSEAAANAHESGKGMTGALAVLVVLIVAAALAPHVLASFIAPVAREITGVAPVDIPALSTVATANGMLWFAIVVGVLLARRVVKARAAADTTWGCGYAAPTSRMQYTSRSFAELVSERFLPPAARPRSAITPPVGLFPSRTELSSTYADPVTRGVYEPLITRWGDRFARLRWLQQGVLQAYLLYILVAAIGLLTWISLRSWIEQ
jgi:hydrogenase-4 component B